MKTITILAVGSRGDVQPYIALAKGLQESGYRVRLAAGTPFESFVRSHGVDYVPLRADYYQLMDSPEGQALKSGNPLRAMKVMRATVFPLMERLFEDTWAAAQGTDALIYHPKALSAPHIAEKLNIPLWTAMALPALTPTRAFAAPGVSNRDLGLLNPLTYRLMSAAAAPFQTMLIRFRENQLGLPARSARLDGFRMDGQPIPVLYAFSQYVIPRPSDWPQSAQITGYWFLNAAVNWQPSAALQHFLDAGPAPVYVGFGSMVAEDTHRLTRVVIEGLQQSGVRAVLSSGWGGLRPESLPAEIMLVDDVPHDWLFPRMAAVIHHGGAGTAAAALRAGRVNAVVPFIADQPFWGHRLHQLGAGAAPVHQKKLSASLLAQLIRQITTDRAMQERAQALGESIRAEDGVQQAVHLIQERLGPADA